MLHQKTVEKLIPPLGVSSLDGTRWRLFIALAVRLAVGKGQKRRGGGGFGWKRGKRERMDPFPLLLFPKGFFAQCEKGGKA